MKPIYFVFGFLYFVYILTQHDVVGDTDTDTDEDDDSETSLDDSQSYCFRFTWMGPDYDNSTSNFTTTCTEYMDEKRAEGVPCRQPFVVSFDGTPPDIDYIWENHKEKVVCRRARGQVCAKYTFAFNGEPMNVTYLCTRVHLENDGSVITNGCYSQKVNGYDVEVCVCESETGLYKPCNNASFHNLALGTLVITLLFCFFNR